MPRNGGDDQPRRPSRAEAEEAVRTLLRYSWTRPAPGSADEGLVVATVVADAFCHSMVRALVGALLPVGEGRRDAGWPARVLTAGVRDPAVGVVAGQPRAGTASDATGAGAPVRSDW